MAQVLEVWLFDQPVGTLQLVSGKLEFSYSDDWLQNPNAVPLSHSLPLRSSSFEDNSARPFFAGLLPEGEMRRILSKRLHISQKNDFALLDRIGGECAGAVSFRAPGQQARLQNSEDVNWLNSQELSETLQALPARPMLFGEEGLRLSLAGAQDKLPVVFDGDRLGLPRNGAPSTHILKPDIKAVTGSVENEAFCMTLASLIGMKAATVSAHQIEEQKFLLVERYDRLLTPTSKYERIHQEDFCQALAVLPEMKYQNEGGPNLDDCFGLIRTATRPSAPEVLRMLDAIIFNALIGNHDAHAKNFSLLYHGRRPVLAPFYDLLSTAIYPSLTDKMAMKIGSKYKFTELYSRHWEQFATNAGFTPGQVKRRVLELTESLPSKARELQASPKSSFTTSPEVDQICQLIESRCALTQDRLR